MVDDGESQSSRIRLYNHKQQLILEKDVMCADFVANIELLPKFGGLNMFGTWWTKQSNWRMHVIIRGRNLKWVGFCEKGTGCHRSMKNEDSLAFYHDFWVNGIIFHQADFYEKLDSYGKSEPSMLWWVDEKKWCSSGSGPGIRYEIGFKRKDGSVSHKQNKQK